MIRYEDRFFIFDDPENLTWKRRIRIFLREIKAIAYKMRLDACRPEKKDDKKKYRVSICAIFKNEEHYLSEWIAFHKIVGVDHFYMYNNNSDDNYLSVLQPYIESGDVTLIDWPYNQAQMQAYKHCISNYKEETIWLGFIDLDEFVVPKETDTIYDSLRPFEKNRGAVMLYWKLFGTSGRLDRSLNGLVTEDFTLCWSKYFNIGKCFYNTRFDFDADSINNRVLHHNLWTLYKGKNIPPVNIFDEPCFDGRHKVLKSDFPIQINHYFTKSYMEYAAKRAKGDVYFAINPHDEAYFYEHEMKCMDTDYSAYKYLIRLKLALKKGM